MPRGLQHQWLQFLCSPPLRIPGSEQLTVTGSEKLFPTLLEDFIIFFFNIMCVRSQTQDTGLAKALINIPKLILT